jgi:hypothetical protein
LIEIPSQAENDTERRFFNRKTDDELEAINNVKRNGRKGKEKSK